MKRMRLIITFMILATTLAFAQTSDSPAERGGTEQELIRLKREWGQAYVRRDAAALDRLLGAEYTVTDAEGQTTERTTIINDFKAGEAVYESATYNDAKVRVYGEVAIVAGRGEVKGRGKTGTFHTQYHSTNVFVRRDGRWQAVATHISGVKRL